MKNCDIARDLMPLCADGLASEESEAFVKAHIEECEDCRASFGRMTAGGAEPAAETEKADFKRALSREKRRRLTWALVLSLIVLTLGAALTYALSEDVFSIIKIDRSPELQSVAIVYDKLITGAVQNEDGTFSREGFSVRVRTPNGERALIYANCEFIAFTWKPNEQEYVVTFVSPDRLPSYEKRGIDE